MEYDTIKYKIWTWKNPIMLHWIVNPGLAFNELVLGQRVPKIMLIERDASKNLQEKTFVPCPHCGILHSGQKWSIGNNAFKNWFGLYCDACGKIIPCLRNLMSLALMLLTYPVWYWLKDSRKSRWLAKQPARYKDLNLTDQPNPYEGKGWIREGLYWGLIMYIMMTFFFPLIDGSGITLKNILVGIPIWAVGGVGFGYSMKLILGKSRVRSQKS
ncbi:MAG: hypothetical protein J5I59_10620 [Saprospiraceae bacterium]|nr:hypothetical protein [Saprospiraceae bacterium]